MKDLKQVKSETIDKVYDRLKELTKYPDTNEYCDCDYSEAIAFVDDILSAFGIVTNVNNRLDMIAKTTIKYIAENHHPHTTAIVTSEKFELVEGINTISTDEYIVD